MILQAATDKNLQKRKKELPAKKSSKKSRNWSITEINLLLINRIAAIQFIPNLWTEEWELMPSTIWFYRYSIGEWPFLLNSKFFHGRLKNCNSMFAYWIRRNVAYILGKGNAAGRSYRSSGKPPRDVIPGANDRLKMEK